MGQDLKSNEGQVHSQLTLIELLKKDPANPQTWAMLATLVDSPERKKIYIQKALDLNPDSKELQEQARAVGLDAQQKIVAPAPIPVKEDLEVVLEAPISDPIQQDEVVEKTQIIEPIKPENITEATIISEPEDVDGLIEQTVISDNTVDVQQETKIQSLSTIEETIENEPKIVVDPTIVDGHVGVTGPEVSLADDARTRVQEILSALGVQADNTNVNDTVDASIINDIDETKVVAPSTVEDTIIESSDIVDSDPQNTIVQEYSELSQKETIVESHAIIEDPFATVAQEMSLDDTAISKPISESDAAQQRIDQIRDSIKPLEEPAIQQTHKPISDTVAPDAQIAAPLPIAVEDYDVGPTEVIDPPTRILQGLLAVASVIAFSFFAYEFIEFLNSATGFTWPDYR